MAETVNVANHMSRPAIFPRVTEGGIQSPLTVEPGHVGQVPADLWDQYKNTAQIQHLIKVGALSEVKDADIEDVPIYTETTSKPEIPDHLQNEEEVQGEQSAQLKRTKPGKVTIDLVAE